MTSKTSANGQHVAEALLHPTPSHPVPPRIGTPPYPPQSGGRGSRKNAGVPEEHKALVREARAVWEEVARKRSNPYVDSAALLLVGRMVLEATRWEDGLVILEAIRQRMEGKSSPRWIPEWSRELGADKREREHHQRTRDLNAVPDDPETRAAILAGIRKAKAEMGTPWGLSQTCCVCGQFTESKCPTCRVALHGRACPLRHACEVPA